MVSVASALHRFKRAIVPPRKHLAANALIARVVGYSETEISALPRLIRGRRTAVDIGANCGDYTHALSRLFRSVYAFEPNSKIAETIRAASLPNVQLECVALSSYRGRATLKLPIVNGQILDGWATLENRPLNTRSINSEIDTHRLDDYDLLDVDFIKIDVEAHELSVLAGAFNTIARCRPVCLIEWNGDDRISRFFEPFGYSACRALSPQNILLVPN